MGLGVEGFLTAPTGANGTEVIDAPKILNAPTIFSASSIQLPPAPTLMALGVNLEGLLITPTGKVTHDQRVIDGPEVVDANEVTEVANDKEVMDGAEDIDDLDMEAMDYMGNKEPCWLHLATGKLPLLVCYSL
jgi:hypothetical protein